MNDTPAGPGINRWGVQPCYADEATFRRVVVVGNEKLSPSIYRLTFQFEQLAASCRPGQFFMVRMSDTNDPLIGRPFALFDSDPVAGTVEMVFTAAGNLTRRLACVAAGSGIEVWGPLGNGFSLAPAQKIVIVAGGIGYTPFLATIRAYLGRKAYGCPDPQIAGTESVTMFFGARTAHDLVSLESLREAGANLMLATDDGSQGFHGFVTDLVRPWLAAESQHAATDRAVVPGSGLVPLRMLSCGPFPMMKLAAENAAVHGVPCEVSLETPMACGIGICFSCVAPVKTGSGWDYRRCCVDGPVFDGCQIEW